MNSLLTLDYSIQPQENSAEIFLKYGDVEIARAGLMVPLEDGYKCKTSDRLRKFLSEVEDLSILKASFEGPHISITYTANEFGFYVDSESCSSTMTTPSQFKTEVIKFLEKVLAVKEPLELK